MSGIPGSRVAGVGPTPPGEQPHHRACRQRTPEEARALRERAVRDGFARLAADRERRARREHARTCYDATCYCDWSPA